MIIHRIDYWISKLNKFFILEECYTRNVVYKHHSDADRQKMKEAIGVYIDTTYGISYSLKERIRHATQLHLPKKKEEPEGSSSSLPNRMAKLDLGSVNNFETEISGIFDAGIVGLDENKQTTEYKEKYILASTRELICTMAENIRENRSAMMSDGELYKRTEIILKVANDKIYIFKGKERESQSTVSKMVEVFSEAASSAKSYVYKKPLTAGGVIQAVLKSISGFVKFCNDIDKKRNVNPSDVHSMFDEEMHPKSEKTLTYTYNRLMHEYAKRNIWREMRASGDVQVSQAKRQLLVDASPDLMVAGELTENQAKKLYDKIHHIYVQQFTIQSGSPKAQRFSDLCKKLHNATETETLTKPFKDLGHSKCRLT